MKSLEKQMKSCVKTFARFASKKEKGDTVQLLTEHYPMLARCAREAVKECKKAEIRLKDPELLPGLFGKCQEMCCEGILPDSDGIIVFFGNEINGICASYLPLAVTCALLKKSEEAVTNDDCVRLKNSVLSLQKMRNTDFDYISEKLFAAEKILLSDPEKIYRHLDSESKKRYRRKIAYLALQSGKSELSVAEDILKKSKKDNEHIGKYLFSASKTSRRSMFLLISEALFPALICLSAGLLSGEWVLSLLLFLPVWEIMRCPIVKASVRGAAPKKLLSLDSQSEKVSDCHVLITVSTILPSADKTRELKDKLERLYLSNAEGNYKICCLADFKAADMPRKPEDKRILNSLSGIIDELNKKYGGGFIAAVRPRSYSETQNEFIGKERKRGAITELIRAVKGNRKGFMFLEGDVEHLSETKYLIVLDYDSRPVFGSVKKLVAVAEHPLNKPIIKNGRVASGYGILAPATQNSLSSASKTFFSSVMSGDSGVSSYDTASSERYMDLFGESIFCGKGLINIDAYYALLDKGLPREKILSHDILEGEFLRTGFVPDVQIIEDFPSDTESYYKRLHRWVRGDWQNAGFIFKKNNLKVLSRYKLFDNLRRSITPIICVAVMIYSAFYQGYAGITAAVIAAFALCAADVYAGVNSVISGGIRSVTGLYYSKRLPDALACFVRAFFSLAFSAREAFICFDAVVKSLWRVLVSGDNLLEWTTFASEEQSDGVSIPVSCLPALTVSVLLIVFGLPLHRLLGLIILADIPLMLFGNTSFKRKSSKITEHQREYLMSYASAMWEYFEDLCTQESNYLPPDNIQLAPHRAVACRTSPTNIGLMLACFLAARDFGFITSQELCERMKKSLESIEKLEKYKGNLLNWYSTATLETLKPRFVSAVDSGNFLCCLTAVKEGIREYAHECSELEETAEKMENIIASTDLSAMYNKQRRLFNIGINPDTGEKTESCYDLYMSEIRMTAYFAVARKIVPRNHWGSLDRPLVKRGRYMGLASWTGTMFEYFMADIFIPSPYGSMSDETLRFCFQSQRKKAGKNPFGISESAFYDFDADLNYQYKAHGVQSLGLKRGLDKETVVSPYSSFLTLNLAPSLSLKNLKFMEKLGMTGKYGFYEAADFTKGRNGNGFSVINSFMVHHIGMSFLSVDNILNEKCMQKRFMNDRYMKGAESLLEEKPPFGKEIFKDIVSDTRMPALRERVSEKNTVFKNPNVEFPKFSVLTNGRMTVCVSDTGLMSVILDGESIFQNEKPAAVTDFFEFNSEKHVFCVASDNIAKESLKAKLSNREIEFTAQSDMLLLKMQIYLLKNSNCIIKKYTLKNKDKKETVNGKLVVPFEKTDADGIYTVSGFVNADGKYDNGLYISDVTLESGECREMVFAFSADITQDDAENEFEALRKTDKIKKALNPFYKNSFQRVLSEKYVSDIICQKNKASCDTLEKFGITKDNPIIMVEINCAEELEAVRPFIVFNKNLRNCGIKNTLVIYNKAPENEKKAVLQTIETFLNEERCIRMLGIGGGIYVLNGDNYEKTDYEELKAASAVNSAVREI